MAQKSKTKAQLEAELKFIKQSRVSERIASVLLSLIRWGGIVGTVYFGYLSIESLAGQKTSADIGVNFLANIDISVALAWAVGAGGVLYGSKQKKLRKDTIEKLQKRIKELELKSDFNRSSSELTSRGDTRLEDRI